MGFFVSLRMTAVFLCHPEDPPFGGQALVRRIPCQFFGGFFPAHRLGGPAHPAYPAYRQAGGRQG